MKLLSSLARMGLLIPAPVRAGSLRRVAVPLNVRGRHAGPVGPCELWPLTAWMLLSSDASASLFLIAILPLHLAAHCGLSGPAVNGRLRVLLRAALLLPAVLML